MSRFPLSIRLTDDDVVKTEIVLSSKAKSNNNSNNKWKVIDAVEDSRTYLELEIEDSSGIKQFFRGFPIGYRLVGDVFTAAGVKAGVFQLEKK